ncbi:MAG: glycosyltransferase family 2 protein [Rhodoferax sp.]|uniref:glycosyltransferase family 2 protein n=1 Tax=Rhodoferax sp. TaxID=50421 RepID=UPI0026081BA4|nr:glycosyltransferase family 2 protein [Rhodoferax sp.]MDD2881492.1 glycosyltransferase family 2 protein [Rhodoferax sp.]
MVTNQLQPSVCISILNWNNADETLHCLESLKKINQSNVRIIVLDNGSTDDSIQKLQVQSGFELITSATNLGFAGGHNKIIQYALDHDFKYVWLLNNDALVAEKCLEHLTDHAEQHTEGALFSPVIKNLSPPHKLQHVISLLNATQTGVEEYLDIDIARELQQEQPDKIILWGTALFLRCSAVKHIGLLDEKLFAYSEDTDYSMRSIKNGYRNQIVFNAEILHHQPVGPRKPHYYYYTQRNGFLTWKKYVSFKDLMRLARWNLQLARKLKADIPGQIDAISALKLGIWHGWTNRGGPYNSQEKLGVFPTLLVNSFLAIS